MQERTFSADSVSLDLAWVRQEPLCLSVSFCVISREAGAQVGTRGIMMFIGTLSVTFCCF